ncbi:MAG: peptide chain release factor N(5)-glutamine methyltransferase, partial [Opitutales bacterium]
AEWIVSHVLEEGRWKLPLFENRELTIDQIESIDKLATRRAFREPLQYVLGNATFANLDLKVDARALIPRPETEEFLELIVNSLERFPDRILDLGTGSGALALGLAQKFPASEVIAVDQSEDALALAKENAERNELLHRVTFISGDWFETVEGVFDLIVSNPPYLDDSEWMACEPEIRDHEPKNALVAELDDNAADVTRIMESALSRMLPGGLLALETGEDQHAILMEIAIKTGYSESRGMVDIRDRPRFFFARRAS